ncbi:ATP-grasp domain-containing protein [Arthrobacter sp. RT-1]|uniref:ATP-grasp domain-containing protein n=1 Tax=Arthrobacter sp. RT-1 TaxID=2292263 RepID=UPI000E1ECE90|nr:ATP-grasp domain-containing protein [Arthrobacter sp. RT-1]RDV09354.1 ATP-grasp domain-containing protein [Arthrobacter sp. RT-1]
MTNWLLSSGGRRGALVKILRGIGEGTDRVSVIDNSRLSAAGMLADDFGQVPKVSDPRFCSAVLEYARKFNTDVIIPTIDPEIEVYARNIDLFRSAGIDVWVSSPEVARLGFDKWLLFKWLRQHKFPTMATVEAAHAMSVDWEGPSVAKPRNGSSSVGVIYSETPQELHRRNLAPDYIVQPRIVGAEVTVDFAVNRKGRCLGVVPRRRLETRGGEVSKGVTVFSKEIISLTEAVAEALPGAYGVLNLQLFYDHNSGDLSILEINPRFGGGYPLAHASGGDLVSALLHSEAAGHPKTLQWRPGTVMLRYDESVIFADDRFGVNPWH